MVDLSKLILLTSVNTFKADNDVQTGSFVLGGSAPEMASTGMITRTFTVTLAVTADYYDIMFNGPYTTAFTYPNWAVDTNRWAAPGRGVYRIFLNATGYSNENIGFEIFTSLSGRTLTITAVSQNQFLASSATLTNATISYRIIPYSSTTQ